MATTFTDAPEVREIAEELISEFHPHLSTWQPRIDYVFTDKTPKKNGKVVLGVARKIGSLSAYLAWGAGVLPSSTDEDEEDEDDAGGEGLPIEEDTVPQNNRPFFAIVISQEPWEELGEGQRRALVDHELCHLWCGLDLKGNLLLKLVGHDVEEFSQIIDRHGLWERDLRVFGRSVRSAPQLTLEMEAA